MTAQTYDVFISYSSKDKEWVRGELLQRIEKAGLRGVVDFKLGDARESLRKLTKKIDFVLLDLWKELYIPCFDLFYPKLRPGALIIADNMITPESSRKEAAAYQRHIRTMPGIQSLLLNVGFGLELTRYK